MFLLIGTYSVLRGADGHALFYQNLSDLPNQIRLGTMDFHACCGPVNSQFFVSLRYVSLDNLGHLVGAVGLLGYGLSTPARVALSRSNAGRRLPLPAALRRRPVLRSSAS